VEENLGSKILLKIS